MSNPDLSIIIVNWNSVAYLRNCLQSLGRYSRATVSEIIVVDNASHDGCDEFLGKEHPLVKFFQSPDNVGFSRANNLGAHHASGRVLLFLNPDTEVVESAIERMFSELSSRPGAGAVGCKLLNTDYSLQTSCIRRYPTIMNQTLDFDFLMTAFPRWRLWGMESLSDSDNPTAVVEVVSGACIMVKRHAFEEVGGFSVDYFMYAEDIDLCYKINRAGYKMLYVGSAQVIHHGGGSSRGKKESNFSAVLMRESRLKYFKIHRGKTYATLYRLSTAVVSAVRLLGIAVLMPVFTSSRNKSLSSAFKKWISILRWSVGLEKWVKDLTYNRKSP